MRTGTGHRERLGTVLHMVMTLTIMILLAQLWLFTVALETVEIQGGSTMPGLATVLCSTVGCAFVWMLIRFFLRTEHHHARRSDHDSV